MLYDLALLIRSYLSEDEREQGEGEIAATKDGLADMMSRILNQQTGANPVLAKRKTPLMKGTSLGLYDIRYTCFVTSLPSEMEREKEQLQRLKEIRAERKARKEKQLVLPDPSTADFERQLRKLATKGGEFSVRERHT